MADPDTVELVPVEHDPFQYDLRPIPQLTEPLWRSASDRYRASQYGDETRLPRYDQGNDFDPRQQPYPESGPQLMPELGPAVPVEDRRGEPTFLPSVARAFTGRLDWSDMLKHPEKFFERPGHHATPEEINAITEAQRSPLAQDAGMRSLQIHDRTDTVTGEFQREYPLPFEPER